MNPTSKPLKMSLRVIDNQWMTPTVFSLKFTPAEQDKIPGFAAGQFVSVTIPGAGPKGRDLRRAYSIASPPEQEYLELCVKLVPDGPGTQYLSQLKKDDLFEGILPFGDFVYKTEPSRHVCFVATGTGVAPFRAMALSKNYQQTPPASAICLFGSTREEELLYDQDFSKLSSIKWVPCLSRCDENWNGFKGRVTHYLRESKLDWANTDFYLCGNGQMISEVKAFLMEEMKVEKKAVIVEKYY